MPCNLAGPEEVQMPAEQEKVRANRALLRFLQHQGRVSAKDVLRLEGLASLGGRPVIEVLESEGVIGQRELALLLAQVLRLPVADLARFPFSPQVTGALKGSSATRYGVIPLCLKEDVVEVATANPLDVGALRAIEFAMGRQARVSVATHSEIREALIQAYGAEQPLARSSTDTAAATRPHTEPEFEEQNGAPGTERQNEEPLLMGAGPAGGVQSEADHAAVRAWADQSQVLGDSLAQSAIDYDEITRPVASVAPRLHAVQGPGAQAVEASPVAELQRLIEQVQREHLATEADTRAWGEHATARAAEAAARADDAVQRVEALVTGSQAREASTAERLGRVAADCDTLSSAVRAIERRVATFTAREEPSSRVEIHQLIQEVQRQRREAEADERTISEHATARAAAALARADEAVQRIEALATAAQARDATSTERIGGLSADCSALSSSVREIDQRLTDLAAQPSPRAELQELIEQTQQERRAEIRAFSEHAMARAAAALTRADEAVQRIEALATAAQARDATSTERIGGLSGDCNALSSSVREIEQRLTDLVAQPSPRAELQELIEQTQRERGAEMRAFSEHATARAAEALARADDAVERIEALAAAARARDAVSAELIAGLSADCSALSSSVCEIEQRLTDLAAQLSPHAELQELIERTKRERRAGDAEMRALSEHATARAAAALARADDAVQRIEALAATVQAHREQAESVVALRESVEHLAEERKQLEVQVEEVQVWVATLNEAVLSVLQRVRRIKAPPDASPDPTPSHSSAASPGTPRNWSTLASAVSVALLTPYHRNAGANRRVDRRRPVMGRMTDVLLIGGLILVAAFAYFVYEMQ